MKRRTVLEFARLQWLDRRRVAAYSAILGGGSIASLPLIYRAALGPGGSDFLAFWSAAWLTVRGAAADAYDPVRLAAVQAMVGREDVFAFVNPPPLLLAIWPLGLLGYPAAWIVWVGAGFAAWALATRPAFPRLTLPIVAFPGALLAAWHAQTGFLTSALQALAVRALPRYPFIAGLWIGALVVKPHLAVLFPVALLAGRQWRAILGALTSAAGLLALSWAVLGSAAMLAYPKAWAVSGHLMAADDPVFFMRQTTVYAQFRAIGWTSAATAAQALVTLAVVVVVWREWARPGALEGKLALLLAATPLATPYLFSYDLPFLVLPVCWLVEHWRTGAALGAWRRPVLLALYVAPLATRALALPLGINLMPLASAAMLWLVWRSLEPEAEAGDPALRPGPAAGT